ncbi:hypothetical protein JCM15124A_15700 [Prevotella falsenii]
MYPSNLYFSHNQALVICAKVTHKNVIDKFLYKKKYLLAMSKIAKGNRFAIAICRNCAA